MLNNNTVVIGLTGMSGSGKSTACGIFRDYGFEIIDCDLLSRQIVEKTHPCFKEIVAEFSSDILDKDGGLDRRKMAELIFSSPEKRKRLNGIMYPYISYIVINQIVNYDQEERHFVVLDAPTLFESGIDEMCDYIVSVVADEKTLIKRIMERDGIDERLARRRLSSQQNKEFYSERSDFCADNCGNMNEFIDKVKEIAETILRSRE